MSTSLIVDPVLAAAVDAAHEALVSAVPADSVGDHLGVEMEAELLATHLFECTNPGYRGWRWAVTVTRVSDADTATVCETVLLPSEGALLAPEWVPWEDRVQPGDLGVGDVLPTPAEDDRLVPGYTGADQDMDDDDELSPVLWELGLGRVRVLSVNGRDEAAQRWIAGDTGPKAPIAKAANDTCSTCGFLVPMTGPLGRAFGLCANELSPADGRVVALTHGCGAHSEVEPTPVAVPVVDLVIDDHSPELLDTEDIAEDDVEAPAIADAEAAEDNVHTADEEGDDHIVDADDVEDEITPVDDQILDAIEDVLIDPHELAAEDDVIPAEDDENPADSVDAQESIESDIEDTEHQPEEDA